MQQINYHKSKPKENERWRVELIEKILEKFPTFGYRRIRIKLKEMKVSEHNKGYKGNQYKSISSWGRYVNKK